MDKLEPKLATANDSIRVALVRYAAYLTLNDVGHACSALSRVKARAAGTQFANRVDGKLEGSSCP
jgi:hypothetical protein